MVNVSEPPFWTEHFNHIVESEDEFHLVYHQSTGNMYMETIYVDGDRCHHHRVLMATGYSGRGEYRNSGQAEHVAGKGPIPRGHWHTGRSFTSKQTGPIAIPLYWVDDGEGNLHGRSGFQIHGDNYAGDASSGCIVLERPMRLFLDYIRSKKEVLDLYVVP